MKRLALVLFVLSVFAFSAFAQNVDSGLKTVELFSPLVHKNQIDDPFAGSRYCFNFVAERIACERVSDLYYGQMRLGNDWDWFQGMGDGSRNKIKDLGRKNWTDNFKVPVVEPYAQLKPGESRRAGLDSSVKQMEIPRPPDAASIRPAGNREELNDSGNLEKSMSNPRTETVAVSKKKSNYQPYKKVVEGNMYVMRVVDEDNDFYVLFRVDELERGKRVKLSWKRIEAPKED